MGMAQQVVDRDAAAGVLAEIGKIFKDRAVQLQSALFNHHQRQHGRELLADGEQGEPCVRRVRNIPFHVGRTEGFSVDHPTLFRHQGHAIDQAVPLAGG
jgi:hypothetical protein